MNKSGVSLGTMVITRGVARRPTGAGAVFGTGILAAIFIASCSPGALPCTGAECDPYKAGGAGGGGAGGGGAGGGGSGGGGGGGSGGGGGRLDAAAGAGGGGAGGGGMGGRLDAAGGSTPQPDTGGGGTPMAAVTATTMVPGCAAPNTTVGAIETNIIAMKCGGKDSGCHQSASAWSDFKTTDIYKRLIGVDSKWLCKSNKLVDTSDMNKSIFLMKIKGLVGTCPSGAMAFGEISKMPPPNEAQLTAAEVTCIEAYVKRLAGK